MTEHMTEQKQQIKKWVVQLLVMKDQAQMFIDMVAAMEQDEFMQECVTTFEEIKKDDVLWRAGQSLLGGPAHTVLPELEPEYCEDDECVEYACPGQPYCQKCWQERLDEEEEICKTCKNEIDHDEQHRLAAELCCSFTAQLIKEYWKQQQGITGSSPELSNDFPLQMDMF